MLSKTVRLEIVKSLQSVPNWAYTVLRYDSRIYLCWMELKVREKPDLQLVKVKWFSQPNLTNLTPSFLDNMALSACSDFYHKVALQLLRTDPM